MENVARKLDRSQIHHEVGEVVGLAGDDITVTTGAGEYTARKAPSCLVAPELGDGVLLASTPAGSCFVVAVLERDAERPTRIDVTGDVDVRLANGRFSVTAQEGIELKADRELRIDAPAIEVHAVTAEVKVETLHVVAARVRAELQRVRTYAAVVDNVFGLLTERAKRVIRRVEEFEHVRAENLDYEAEATLSLHAENTIIEADVLVKVDAEQIHIG